MLLLCMAWSVAQVVYTETAVVQQSSTGIVVYFNAAEGNKGLMGYTGEVYAHTGVITSESTGNSDWKHAPSEWGDNSAKYKLENAGTDLWRLNIGDLKSYYELNEGETVQRMAFVFRSSDNKLEGKTAGGGDIFVEVYPDGLAVSLTSNADSYVLTDDNSSGEVETSKQEAANDARQNFLDQMNQMFEQILQDKASIQAMSYVPAGTRIIIFPKVDLWLRTVDNDEDGQYVGEAKVLINDQARVQGRDKVDNPQSGGRTATRNAAPTTSGV